MQSERRQLLPTAAELNQAEQDTIAEKALRNAGLAECQGKTTALTKLLIDLINLNLSIFTSRRMMGGTWKPPAPAVVARSEAADEAKKVKLDLPREVLKIGRRIQLGAKIDSARLTEPVLGAMLVMSKVDLGHLLNRNMDEIDQWIAVQQGVAAPDPVRNLRIGHAPRRRSIDYADDHDKRSGLSFAQ